MTKGFVILLWLSVMPFTCWGQASTKLKGPDTDCIDSALTISDTSFTSQKLALDSIAVLLVGRWKLIRVGGGWSAPKTPNWSSELMVDRDGQCVILVDGNWVSSFRITLTIHWRRFLFAIEQHKGAHFLIAPSPSVDNYGRKRNRRGHLKLCESMLFLSDNSADGQHYLYERLTNQEPNIASLTPVACRDSLSQVEQVYRVKGTVLFRNDLQAYVIDYSLAGSPSTHLIGIICNWPQAKDYINRVVSYSGNYYDLPGLCCMAT